MPLYHFDESRNARAALWGAITTELAREGLTDVPEALEFNAPPVPARIADDLIFSQVCGYALQTIYRGQAVLLGAPVYDFEYSDGATHAGVFVVREDRPYRTVADLRDSRFACGSRHSNSSMNLPRWVLASLAQGKPFFKRIEVSGNQRGNLDRVVREEVDATCVDSVTLGYYRHWLPEQAAKLRVLAVTPSSPSIPYITSSATDPAMTAALRQALQRVAKSEQWAQQRKALFLHDIVPIKEGAYAKLLDFERTAIQQGYPEIH